MILDLISHVLNSGSTRRPSGESSRRRSRSRSRESSRRRSRSRERRRSRSRESTRRRSRSRESSRRSPPQNNGVSPPHYDEVPRYQDQKPLFGPRDSDGSIKVKYPSQIDGYGVDDNAMAQMESMGLPTGFSFNHAAAPQEKQKKGDKKTFYCQICLIELNSLDTMKSHVQGVSKNAIFGQ